MKALAIAETNLRRLFRERANVFFLFVLPMLVILLLGSVFGSESARIGVAAADSGRLGDELVASLAGTENLDVRRFMEEQALERAVERGRVEAGLVVPPRYDETLRRGRRAVVRYFARPDSLAEQLRAAVDAAVAAQSARVRAARFLVARRPGTFAAALRRASGVAPTVAAVSVSVTTAERGRYPSSRGRFDLGASTQLLLFIFLTSLTGAAALIASRRLGVSRRMLSTPTPTRTVLAGEALGRFGIALLQAVLIVGGSLLFFGVSWGDPLGATALVLAFCVVGTGAGMLLGSVLANDEQAGAVSLLVGLGLAALGGSMVPLEVFPDAMRVVAHATPHAWGNEGFAELLRHDGRLVDVLPQVAALLAYGVALLGLATWRLHRALTA